MNEIRVEAMAPEHYDQVHALWAASPAIGVTPSDSSEAIERYLGRNPGLSLVALDAERRVVGAVLCGHDGARGYIRHLIVAEDYRQKGIGRRLIDTCLAGLAALGIGRCTIFVFAGNEEGQAFWTRSGWRPRHELRAMSKDLWEEPC